MNRNLLEYYNRELQFLREMGAEFRTENPKIAGRLGIEGVGECPDPYVERLLESFAFLAARVQLKLDAQFPRFTQSLLGTIYPHYAAPTPSMAILQLEPDLNESALADGLTVPRNSVMRSILGKGDATPCEYRLAHDVVLWPIELAEAEYFGREISSLDLPNVDGVRAGVRLRLRCAPGMTFKDMALDTLTFHLGGDAIAVRLYEQILAHTICVVARPTSRPLPWSHVIDKTHVQQVGFDDDQALLPYGIRSFQGYRLLREYFALPSRFLFVAVGGLDQPVRRCDEAEMDLIFLFDEFDRKLERAVDTHNFRLFCSPAANLFPKRTDRIHLTDRSFEHHVVPDRTRPLDFEVFEVQTVTGFGETAADEQRFKPFYASGDFDRGTEPGGAYFATNRMPRNLTSREKRLGGPRSSYAGTEVFISLVDAQAAPYRTDMKQLAVTTLCTNRDLPLQMPLGQGTTDFSPDASLPVVATRCIAGPTLPMPSHVEGHISWRLISHLTLNYLSITDSSDSDGAAALRGLLKLYGDSSEAAIRKQIDGIKSVANTPITRRVRTPGPITFARGLGLCVTFDEDAFEGSGVFLLGSVLERFFAKYVSINSFTKPPSKPPSAGR